MTTTNACTCWTGPVRLHPGHCCFLPQTPDDCHTRESQELVALAQPCPDCGAIAGEPCHPLCTGLAAAQDGISSTEGQWSPQTATLAEAASRAHSAAERLDAWPETASVVRVHLTVVTCGLCSARDVWVSVYALEQLATTYELTTGPFLRAARQETAPR